MENIFGMLYIIRFWKFEFRFELLIQDENCILLLRREKKN